MSSKRDQVIKLLLLGPGESGKTTFLKQIQIINMNGFTKEDIQCKKKLIYYQIKLDMFELIKQMDVLGIEYKDPDLKIEAEHIERQIVEDYAQEAYEPLYDDTIKAIKRLWKDAGIQECYRRKNEFQICDSAKYFFDNIDRVGKEDYTPTNNDILQLRVTTLGVNCIDFRINNYEYRIYDAGGQRSQRRKWLQYFDDINAMIFISALSEYTQTLREDHNKNRMIETFELFEEVVNHPAFEKAGIILFLNKTDLFKEKIKKFPLNKLFANYKGGPDYKKAVEYIIAKFRRRYKNKSNLYTFETCATNTDQIRTVSDAVFKIVYQSTVKNLGSA